MAFLGCPEFNWDVLNYFCAPLGHPKLHVFSGCSFRTS